MHLPKVSWSLHILATEVDLSKRISVETREAAVWISCKMSGEEEQPNCAPFDQNMSQNSDAGLNLSQPLSQDTFNLLWSQINGMTDNGNLISSYGDPTSWNFSEFQPGEMIENNIDVQLQHVELAPQGIAPDITNFPQTQSFQPNMLPDNAAPGPPLSEYSTDTTTTTPPPTSAASQALPSNVDYTGDYGFEIYLGQPTSTAAKSVSWTYSQTLKKLFVDKDKACPIMFKTTHEPPAGSYIRAMPIFKKPEYIQETVRRCPNHTGPSGELSGHHLITCSDPSAIYEEDPTTGRMSVMMAYNMPQVGTEHTTYLLTFKCFLSCVGGLNRRQIQTVFTLENNGQVLGRQVIDVRVCACPGRDRKGEEKHQSDKQSKKPLKRGQSKMSQSFSVTHIGGKRKKPDEEVYCIMVKGRANYEILMRIKESLELMSYVTQDQRNQHKAEQARLQQQIPNMPRFNSFSSSASQQQGSSPLNNPPLLPSQPSLESQMAALQRHGTLPLHTLARHQTPHAEVVTSNSVRDHCDGPSAMEVDQQPKFTDDVVSSQEISSSQMLGGQSSPNGQRSEDQAGLGHMGLSQVAGTSQVSPVDRSIRSWLGGLGCQQYIDIFTKKGVRTIDQLDEINLEDFTGITMPQQHREKLWKAILHLRRPPIFTSTPSSLLRTGSNASTASFGSLSGLSASQVQRIQATRFTLKQTMSFKVKEEQQDDEEDS
ncbi:cellular tumor antigen p53-like isoform X2 [Acanthaster planci]|uniref:Cellular tumor antigen p53-like isoform X2 n=1 Tax=Acanthaster planci TaxID=133434 RepID=A0A8B7ZZI4_ACAPL|nr:cellular tumor antigen p53-like isoform X2 [Acanthaster planci]